MQFVPLEFTLINFSIVPLKDSSSAHFSFDKVAIVFSILSVHSFSFCFQISFKLASVLPFTLLHPEFSVPLHEAIYKGALIFFSIGPSILSLGVFFFSIHELSYVLASISIGLLAFSMGAIILPLAFVSEIIRLIEENSFTIHSTISDSSSFEGSIRIYENGIISSGFTIPERSFIIAAVAKVHLSHSIGFPALPMALVISLFAFKLKARLTFE